jgi:hypothetical protein
MPWVYIRSRIARAWGVPPWDVDAAPVDEIATELHLWEIQAEADRINSRKRGRGRG